MPGSRYSTNIFWINQWRNELTMMSLLFEQKLWKQIIEEEDEHEVCTLCSLLYLSKAAKTWEMYRKNKLFIASLWTSHPVPQSHLSLCPFVSALCPATSPLLQTIKKNKSKTKEEATTKKHLAEKAIGCQCVTQYALLSTHLYLQMFLKWVIGLVSGLWLLLCSQYLILIGTLHG